MLRVVIQFTHNDNEITIEKVEHIVSGKPNIEEALDRLTEDAKKEFKGALNA